MANTNVIVAFVAIASWLIMWLSGLPSDMLMLPRGPFLAPALLALALLVSLLAWAWNKLGRRNSAGRLAGAWRFRLAHLLLAAGNIVWAAGIADYVRAAMLSREEEYWAGVFLTSYGAPAGAGLLALGFLVLLSALLRAPEKAQGRVINR